MSILPTQIRKEITPQVQAFVDLIQKVRCTLDFSPSSRGWCYILEGYGLEKSDFDKGEQSINLCRKHGHLPIDICGVDGARKFDVFDLAYADTPEEYARKAIDELIDDSWKKYSDHYFWEGQNCYIQMAVEKGDLKSLFYPICEKYKVPIATFRGWADLNQRVDMMKRFKTWEGAGKKIILLYCGDCDPGGYRISDVIKNNLRDLSNAADWEPDNLIIDRFGLNKDFIEEAGLTWIDNLITSRPDRQGKKQDLSDPKHPDYYKSYVQWFLKEIGPRKCEANALVINPNKGMELCLKAITNYISEDSPEKYEKILEPGQTKMKKEIRRLLDEGEY
ncbi:hypothetical protein ES702_07193 [subsurface metagenome]